MQNLEVLYADSDIVAIHKDPGVPSQSRKSNPRPLDIIVPEYLSEEVKIITRLDQPVSGLVLFKRNRQEGKLNYHIDQKHYLAFVEGNVYPAENMLQHRLKKNNKLNKAVENTDSGKKCRLEYKAISYFDHYTLLQVNLITGRFHQIRAQLSLAGFPIKGDIKYGARRKNKDRSIHLHAFKYKITTNKSISIMDYSFPDDPLWKLVNKELLSQKT
ncbi:pseudouridine synthase [Membranihabitans maritimus]|uniref:pseudouridine synthase n=1 Tax=Membranihabitans maritimus TaxID=2904244 RepID=UPI001F1CDDED|nr:RNA pseudouridine synthase [Membranihabitans maritimus]